MVYYDISVHIYTYIHYVYMCVYTLYYMYINIINIH